MYRILKIVRVDSHYCDFLRTFDSKVSYNAGYKELRPFIGALFKVNDCEYFAPLSSPKPKHKELKNTLDMIRIKDGEYGVINFNNMIPVTKNNYSIIDLSDENKDDISIYRLELLRNQLRWLTKNREEIYKKSQLLYNLYKNDNLKSNVKNRCCNFPLLEEKCIKYNKSNVFISA